MAQRRPSLGESTAELAHISDAQPLDAKGIRTQLRLFLELAIPTTLLNLGFTLSPLLTASYVGLKFGKTFLSAFTLANLTGNLCTFSLLAGLFSAADTLSPQAFGKGDYKEVGLLAIRGVFAGVVLLVPINIFLVLYMEQGLIALGQDTEAAYHATQWYRIFVFALPSFLVYNAAWKFLSSQHVMMPLIIVSVFSCVVILPIALQICTANYGFLGSAVAYVTFQISQMVLLLCYLWWKQPHMPGTWSGLGCWKEALRWKPTMEYLHLGAGGILAQSEWIYWEALGLIIGKLGVLQLSVHTIPNQVIMTMCMAPFAFGIALAIRMGVTLTQSVSRTKNLVAVTILLSSIFFGLLTIVMFVKSEWIFSIFTTDDEVKAMAQTVWWKVCAFNFNVSVFGVLSGVATGLGMQWTLGAVNFFFLWVLGVPITYYATLIQGGGLDAAWTWINAPYACMNLSLLVIFVTKDWHQVRDKIQETSDAVPDPSNMELESQKEHSSTKSGAVNERTNLLNDALTSDYGN